jgi:hypothetical protein
MSACVPPVPAPVQCRQCGCTEELACVVSVDGVERGCRWTLVDTRTFADAAETWIESDLCSACSGEEYLVRRGPARVGGGTDGQA